MVIVFNRESTYNRRVYHAGMAVSGTGSATPATSWIALDLALAVNTSEAATWNSTTPTSTVFSVGTDGGVNQSTKGLVAYCFADVEGYSKFGGYVGNGVVDGPFIYTGFKPAWVIIRLLSGGAWCIQDSARDPYNVMDLRLIADTTAAETTSSNNYIDFLSNGFKPRTSAGNTNANGYTHIFMAFAEYPFGGEDVTPATVF